MSDIQQPVLPVNKIIPHYYDQYLPNLNDNQTSYLELHGYTVISHGQRLARAIRQDESHPPAIVAILMDQDETLNQWKRKILPMVTVFEDTQRHLHSTVPQYNRNYDYCHDLESSDTTQRRLQSEAYRQLGARLDRTWYKRDPGFDHCHRHLADHRTST